MKSAKDPDNLLLVAATAAPDGVRSKWITAIAIVLILAASARLSIASPFGILDTVTPSGSNWIYDYKVTVSTNANALENFTIAGVPDFFGVGDFSGYVAGSQQVLLDGNPDPNWVFSQVANQQLADPGGGAPVSIGSSLSILDLVWTTSSNQPNLNSGLHTFEFIATSTNAPTDGFAGSNYHAAPNQLLALTKSSVDIPAVPEPPMSILAALGIAPFAFMIRKHQRRHRRPFNESHCRNA